MRCTRGPWIAQHGQFFDSWGRRAGLDEMPAMAAAQAARTGWAKSGTWTARRLRHHLRASSP